MSRIGLWIARVVAQILLWSAMLYLLLRSEIASLQVLLLAVAGGIIAQFGIGSLLMSRARGREQKAVGAAEEAAAN